MWDLIIEKSRLEKQRRVMNALAQGMGVETRVLVDKPKDGDNPFVACGQLWVVEEVVPPAIEKGKPFWLVDNGYYRTSGVFGLGGEAGHYEMTYRGLTPIVMDKPDYHRYPAKQVLSPWKHNKDGYVLLALPGPTFGKVVGLDMSVWAHQALRRIRQHTTREIRIRSKRAKGPLQHDLQGAAVVVTHSSNVAVDSVLAGVPAIVAETNPASPVCSTNIADVEYPIMPDRTKWWASLMCQQYTVAEMQDGTAWGYMQRIMEQVDG